MAATYSQVSGYPVGNDLANETPQTTITQSITTGAIGDLMIAHVHNAVYDSGEGDFTTIAYSESLADSADAISWQVAASVRGQDTSYPDTPAGQSYEIWYGVVTKASTTTTVTSTFATGVTDLFLELDSKRSSNGASATWAFTVGDTVFFESSSTTVDYPSLTSGTDGGIYWGYAYGSIHDSTMTAGTTAGFDWWTTPIGNIVCYNLSLAPSTAYAPTCTQAYSGGTGWYDTIGAIFVDTASGGGGGGVTSVAEVQNSGAAAYSTGTSYTKALTGVAAGDSLVIYHVGLTEGATVSSVSDNFANHYTWAKVVGVQNTSESGGELDLEIWLGTPPATGTLPSGSVTATVHLSASDDAGGSLIELNQAVVADVSGTTTGGATTGTALTSPSLTPAAAGEWALMCGCVEDNNLSVFPSSPWANIESPTVSTFGPFGVGSYQALSGTSAVSTGWTAAGATHWCSVGAIFKPATSTLAGTGTVAATFTAAGTGKIVQAASGAIAGSFGAAGTGTARVPAAGQTASTFTAAAPAPSLVESGAVTSTFAAAGAGLTKLAAAGPLGTTFTAAAPAPALAEGGAVSLTGGLTGPATTELPSAGAVVAAFALAGGATEYSPAAGPVLTTFAAAGTGAISGVAAGQVTAGATLAAGATTELPTGGTVASVALLEAGGTVLVPAAGPVVASLVAGGAPTVLVPGSGPVVVVFEGLASTGGIVNGTGGVTAEATIEGAGSEFQPAAGGVTAQYEGDGTGVTALSATGPIVLDATLAGSGSTVTTVGGQVTAATTLAAAAVVVVPASGVVTATFGSSSGATVVMAAAGEVSVSFAAAGTGRVETGTFGGTAFDFTADGTLTPHESGGVVAELQATGTATSPVVNGAGPVLGTFTAAAPATWSQPAAGALVFAFEMQATATLVVPGVLATTVAVGDRALYGVAVGDKARWIVTIGDRA